MTAIRSTVVRFALRVMGITQEIEAPGAIEEVVMAKVIEFYIPKNFRRSFKLVPELQRGRILEFCPQTKKSA
jgi:hypothetical protein